MNLVEANRKRVQLICEIIANRLWAAGGNFGGSWRGYKQNERLEGVLLDDTTLAYRRFASAGHGVRNAVIFLTGLHLQGDDSDAEYGPEMVKATRVTDRQTFDITVPRGASVSRELTAKFAAVRTRDDAFSEALEVASGQLLRLGNDHTIAGGSLSFEQKLTREYTSRFGQSDSTETTETISVHLTEPGVYHYEGTRTVNDVERNMSAHADYGYGIRLVDETRVNDAPGPTPNFWDTIVNWFSGSTPPSPTRNRVDMSWGSVAEFIQTLKGLAPANVALGQNFSDRPEDPGVIAAVQAPPGRSEQLLKYVNVIDDKITLVRRDELIYEEAIQGNPGNRSRLGSGEPSGRVQSGGPDQLGSIPRGVEYIPPDPRETAPCIARVPITLGMPVAEWIRDRAIQASGAASLPPYQLEDRFGYSDSDRRLSAAVYAILANAVASDARSVPEYQTLESYPPSSRRVVVAYLPCSLIDWFEARLGGTKGPVIQGQGVEVVYRELRGLLTEAYHA